MFLKGESEHRITICIHLKPILWPPHAKSGLIGKDPDAGRDRGQEQKGMTEDEMVDGIMDSMNVNLSELQ